MRSEEIKKKKGLALFAFLFFTPHSSLLTPLFLAACSKKPSDKISLPAIPARTLKDPSSLAFDGQKYYVADWTSAGLFEMEAPGPGRFLPTPLRNAGKVRLIQALAIAPNRMIVETDEGRLYRINLSQEAGPPQELRADFDRKPGSLMCWDGLYIRLSDQGRFLKATLLPSGEMASHPSMSEPAPSNSAAGSALSLACGWNQVHVLVKEGEDHAIISRSWTRGQSHKRFWLERDNIPLAITAISNDSLAVLCRRKNQEGAFELILWRTLRTAI